MKVRRRSAAPLLLVAALLTPPGVLATAGPAAADGSQVTVAGPPSAPGSTVTVEQTTGQINQVIRVSWTGFPPSNYGIGTEGLFSDTGTRFPVRVYQCRGTDPVAPTECYGALIYKYPGRPEPIYPNYFESLPDGSPNKVDVATGPDGTGSADLEIRTFVESSTLGCGVDSACSIVVVLNPGHPTAPDRILPDLPACATVYDGAGQTECQSAVIDGITLYGDSINAPWAWDNRVVVPITFADTGESCPIGAAGVSVLGSPKAERAVRSWQPATCRLSEPVTIGYSSQGESAARSAFLRDASEVGLTNRPADPAATTDRTYTYAPITTSGIAVAFRVDDSVTHQPITTMQLTPRLIAKLVTASYGQTGWNPSGTFGNPALEGNPQTIFQDPEFLALNDLGAGHGWSADSSAYPMLMADLSDMTWELTRWLQQDPAARAFLAGEPDEFGMHVNDNYTGILYPAESFELRDPFEPTAFGFQPQQGLNSVGAKLVSNTYVGHTDVELPLGAGYQKFGLNGTGVASPGSRSFIAILDTATAAALRFPVAGIQNASGQFVAPTTESLTAAVEAMTVNADGLTRSADLASLDPAAYPLTMIDYAMVPTSGLDADTAEAAGRLLDYAAGAGQVQGPQVGALPEGYLPLAADLVAQTEAAADAVRAQDGATVPTPTPTPTPSGGSSAPGGGGGSAPGGSLPGGGAPGGGAAPTSGAQPGATPPGGATPGPTSGVAAGGIRPAVNSAPVWMAYLLPVVLIVGLGAALVGSAGSLVLGRGGLAAPAFLRRLRRRPPVGGA